MSAGWIIDDIIARRDASSSLWSTIGIIVGGTDNGRAGRRRWHRFAYYASSLRDLRAARDNIRRGATPWAMFQTYPLGISNRSHNHSVTVSRKVSPYLAFPSQTCIIVRRYVCSKFLARIYDYSFLIEDATIATLTPLTDHLKINLTFKEISSKLYQLRRFEIYVTFRSIFVSRLIVRIKR